MACMGESSTDHFTYLNDSTQTSKLLKTARSEPDGGIVFNTDMYLVPNDPTQKKNTFQCWRLGSCRSFLRSPYQKDNERNLSPCFHITFTSCIVRPSDDGGVDIDCAGDRIFSGLAARSDAPYIHTDRPGCGDIGTKAR
eukprot:scaffold22122_cov55-Attheya_sp.AAC.1